MSAVDFADNTDDLMYIGTYLGRRSGCTSGPEVFRQAATWIRCGPSPTCSDCRRPERLNDLDGLKWASLGILGQAWPKEQANVWQAGLGVAKEVLDKLRAEKRTKEADAFLASSMKPCAAIASSIVTWTGEADVDLLVEEPGGTICSLRNPRTTAAASSSATPSARPAATASAAIAKPTFAPRASDGTYRMLVRRVWGNVTAGKVNVEVVTHFDGD